MNRVRFSFLAGFFLVLFLVVPANAGRSSLGHRGPIYNVQERLERCNRRLATALLDRGMVHYDSKNYDAALRDAKAALLVAEELKGENQLRIQISAHMLSASVHDRRGDKDALSASIDEVVRHKPGKTWSAPGLAVLTKLAQRQGMTDKAIELLTLSLSLDLPPKLEHMARLTRGILHWKQKNLRAAEADLTAVIEQWDDARARTVRAKLYRKQGRLREALADYDAAFKNDFFDPKIMEIAASLFNHIAFGTPTEYINLNKSRIKLPQRFGKAPVTRAILYGSTLLERCDLFLDMKRVEDAAKDCDHAVKLFPKIFVVADVLPRLERARGRPEEAKRWAERAAAWKAKHKTGKSKRVGNPLRHDRVRTKELVDRKVLSPSAAEARKEWNFMSIEMRAAYTALHGR